MRAMVLHQLRSLKEDTEPLTLEELDDPVAGPGEILIRVRACGVCHTELDEIEGRTPPPELPVILGHQVVGEVVDRGEGASGFELGARVGVGWIHSACGTCRHCRRGEENLCAGFQATGRDHNGGYAELMVVPEAFALAIPEVFSDLEAAPLLCAGAIGYRSLRLTGLRDGQRLGLTGFGASGHLVLKVARQRFPNSEVFVFARSERERAHALELGAAWAGDTAGRPPAPLSAIIDTTPAWKPVVEALERLEPGGRMVINAIRKQDDDKDELQRLDYPRHLWLEKEVKSVANVARRDISELLEIAAEIPLRPDTEAFALDEANRALVELKQSKIRGAKVLQLSP